MEVKIEIVPATKGALKEVLKNIPCLMQNVTGTFNCEIKIKACFKQ